jgi:hypothetical protein
VSIDRYHTKEGSPDVPRNTDIIGRHVEKDLESGFVQSILDLENDRSPVVPRKTHIALSPPMHEKGLLSGLVESLLR